MEKFHPKITLDHQISEACLLHRTGTRHLSEVHLRISFRWENRRRSENYVMFDVFGWCTPKKQNGLASLLYLQKKPPCFFTFATIIKTFNKRIHQSNSSHLEMVIFPANCSSHGAIFHSIFPLHSSPQLNEPIGFFSCWNFTSRCPTGTFGTRNAVR